MIKNTKGILNYHIVLYLLYCTRAVQKCPIVHKHCTYIIVIA